MDKKLTDVIARLIFGIFILTHRMLCNLIVSKDGTLLLHEHGTCVALNT